MINKQNLKSKQQGIYRTIETINRNKVAEVYYRKALDLETEKFINFIYKEVEKKYNPIIPHAVNNTESMADFFKRLKNKLLKTFLGNSEKIVLNWWKKLSTVAKAKIEKSFMEVGIKTGMKYNKEFDNIVKLIIERNVGLIQNTTLQTINNIENIVYDGLTTGATLKSVEQDLSKQTHIAKDRIKRIARDQTSKANSTLNEITQRSYGIEFFEWSTSKDERVSTGYGGHKQLDGKIYKWGDVEHYPVCDSYGHKGVPSQRVNCRCTAKAVLLEKDYEAKQLSDGSWVITKGRIY